MLCLPAALLLLCASVVTCCMCVVWEKLGFNWKGRGRRGLKLGCEKRTCHDERSDSNLGCHAYGSRSSLGMLGLMFSLFVCIRSDFFFGVACFFLGCCCCCCSFSRFFFSLSLFLSSFSCFFFSFSSACALRELTCSCSVTMTLNVVSSLRFLFFFWDETEGGWGTDKISETVSIRGSGGGGGEREA